MTQTAWVIFYFFRSSGDKASRGPFLASRQLVQTPPMRFEFSHYPLTPSHHLHAGSAMLGWTARPNEGRRIHRTSEGTLLRIVLSPPPLINLRVAIHRNGDDYLIIVTARLACSPVACLTLRTPPARAARLNNKAVPANPS